MQWFSTIWQGLVWVVLKLTGQCPHEDDPQKTASDPNPTNEALGAYIFHTIPPLGDGEDAVLVTVFDDALRTEYRYERQKSGVWLLTDVNHVHP